MRYLKKYLRFIGFLFVLLTAGYIFLVHTVMPKYIRQMLPEIEALAPDYLNGSVSIGDMTWNGGLTTEISDVVVKDASGEKIAELPRTIIHLRPWMALDTPARAVSRIELVRPQVYLVMHDDERWNMQDLLKSSDSEETPFYGLLEITDGRLEVVMPQGKWYFDVAGTVSGGANPQFAVDAKVTSGVDGLALTGLVNTQGEGRLQLQGDKLDLTPYASLAKHYADIDELQGGLGKLALLYVHNEKGTRFSGEVALAGIGGKMTLSDEQHSLVLDGKIRAHDNVVDVSNLKAVLDEQKLQLEGTADLRNLDEARGEGVLTAQQLAYAGYEIKNLRLPFKTDKQNITWQNASVEYGGGTVIADGAYAFDEKNFTGSVLLKNVTHATAGKPQDDVHISGSLAMLANMQDDKLSLYAAADTMDLQWRSLHINQLAFDGALDDKGLTINHFSALADKNGSLAASGTLAADGTLALKGRMADFPINPLLDIATGDDGSGLCSMGFAIGGKLSAPEFAGVIQFTQAEFMHQKIKEAHGFVSLGNNLLKIKNFSAHMDQGEHMLNGSVDLNGDEPYIDLALETNGVRIEPLLQAVALAAPVTGNLDNIVQMRGTPSHMFVYGEVHASDGSAAAQLFNSVDGRYIYEDGMLQLQNFVVNAFFARIELNGTMTAAQQLDFHLDASNVDLAHLPIHDETVDLDGKVNAKGHLGGTLTSPYFEGDVSSDKLFINGEALTEMRGTLASNAKEKNLFNVSFRQPYNNNESKYGSFSADVNLNTVERFIKGKVVMQGGDIGGVLRIARQDYEINGLMQGSLEFSPKGKGSGVFLSVTADDVKIHDLNYAHMNFKGSMNKGVFSFDDVKLQETDGVTDKGIIAVGGKVDLPGKKLNIKAAAVKANPAVVTAAMKDPPEIKGEMDLLVQLEGSFDDPQGTGSLAIYNGSIAGVGLDTLTAMLSLEQDNIKLEQLIGVKDAYSLKASGDIPVDLFRTEEERRNPQAQMDIRMDLDEGQLGILPAMTQMVEWGVGDTNGQVRLAGTLENPLLYGSVKIEDGSVKVKYLDTVLENINLDVDFQGNTVLLKNFSTKLGKGELAAKGSYALHTDEDTAYALHVMAKNAELDSLVFKGRINSDIEISPQKYRPFRKPDGNRPPPMQYRPLVKGKLRLDDVLVNMPTIPDMGEGESNIGLDMSVELGPKIHLFNSYLYDIWLNGGIHIKGSTQRPQIDGNIRSDKGEIKYLRTDFKINQATLAWVEPGTFLPNVSLESTARFSRYRIFMKINGPVMEMDLQLASDPPMERNTIVRMLTLQRDSAGSNEVTSEDMSNLMTVGLEMTVLGDVEMLVKQTLGLDQFRIYSGKVRSGVGFESTRDKNRELTEDERNQYNVLVSKYLTDKFMLGYTTSFDALDKSIFGQYDITRRFNITYSRSYDMSSDPEDWYGIQYVVNF